MCEHLGGSLAEVKAYNSGGLWLLTPEQLAQEAGDLRNEGDFPFLKFRLGRKTLDQDLRAIEAVRSQMKADDDLLCDFNQVLSFTEALRRLRDLDDQGLYWFEEPIPTMNSENTPNSANIFQRQSFSTRTSMESTTPP